MKLSLHRHILTIQLQKDETSDSILDALQQSRKKKYLLYQNRQLTCNGAVLTRNTLLHKNERLSIRLTEEAEMIAADHQPLSICYEDELFLIVNKPPFLLVHSDGNNTSHTLCNRVQAYFLESGQPQCPVRPIHRLDSDTSGLIVFCKISFFQPMLDALLKEKKIQREYLAFAQGFFPKKHCTIDAPIARDRHHAGKMRTAKQGMEAKTDVAVLRQLPSYAFIRCTLHTGRTHQIRVHLSSISHPLLSDPLYGNTSKQIRRLALHAASLTLYHPLLQKEIKIECPLPADMKKLLP